MRSPRSVAAVALVLAAALAPGTGAALPFPPLPPLPAAVLPGNELAPLSEASGLPPFLTSDAIVAPARDIGIGQRLPTISDCIWSTVVFAWGPSVPNTTQPPPALRNIETVGVPVEDVGCPGTSDSAAGTVSATLAPGTFAIACVGQIGLVSANLWLSGWPFGCQRTTDTGWTAFSIQGYVGRVESIICGRDGDGVCQTFSVVFGGPSGVMPGSLSDRNAAIITLA